MKSDFRKIRTDIWSLRFSWKWFFGKKRCFSGLSSFEEFKWVHEIYYDNNFSKILICDALLQILFDFCDIMESLILIIEGAKESLECPKSRRENFNLEFLAASRTEYFTQPNINHSKVAHQTRFRPCQNNFGVI